MAIPLINGERIKVRFVCYTANQISVNVLHYVAANLLGTVTDADLAAFFDARMSVEYYNLMNNTARYRGCGVAFLRGANTIEEVSVANDGAGTSGATPLPMQSCGMITKRTVLGGRANRGRVYLPFPSSGDSDPALNRPTAGYAVSAGVYAGKALVGFTAVISIGVNEVGLSPALVRRAAGPPVTFTHKLVTGVSMPLKWGTQKRRGNYGKPNALPF